MVVPVEVALGRPRKEDEPLRDALRRVLEKLGVDGKRGHREQGKKRSGPTRSLLMWTWRERQGEGDDRDGRDVEVGREPWRRGPAVTRRGV